MSKRLFCYALATLTTLLCVSVGAALAQSSTHKKAQRFFAEGDFEEAQAQFKKDLDKKPNAESTMGMGNCYRMLNKPKEAAEWYKKEIAYPSYDPMAHIYLFEIALLGNHYDEAKEHLQKFKKLPTANPYVMSYLTAVCDTGAVWIEEEVPGTLKNEAGLNSASSDWGLCEGEDGSYVFYSSRIIDINTPYAHDDKPLQRVMTASSEGESWRKLKAMERPVNGVFNAGPIAFLGDGRSIVARYFDHPEIPKLKVRTTNNAGLFIVAPQGDGASSITPWNDKFNNMVAYSVTSPCLSPDKQTLYFSSNMPGGFGGYDIYYSQRNADDKWGAPINCGAEINTYADEMFPTLGPGGSLFFASNGRAGMGGLDIYITTVSNGKFSPAQNLGYPINSGANDFYLYAQSNDKVFFASNRDGGKGENDIYSFTYDFSKPRPVRSPRIAEEPPLDTTATDTAVVDATTVAEANDDNVSDNVSDDVSDTSDEDDSTLEEAVTHVPVRVEAIGKNKQPIGLVDVVLVNTESDEEVRLRTNAKGIAVLDSVELYTDYTLSVSKAGYGTITIKFNIASVNRKVVARLTMTELLLNRDVRIAGLYYDAGQWTIKPAGEKALIQLAQHLKNDPKMHLEIKSYTNENSKPDQNTELAQKRARTIFGFLARQGVSEGRIIASGVGSFEGAVKAKSYTTYRLFHEGERDVQAAEQRRKALEAQRAKLAEAQRLKAAQQKRERDAQRAAIVLQRQTAAAANKAQAQAARKPVAKPAPKPAAKPVAKKPAAKPTVTYSTMEIKPLNDN
jgi:outer membrane protein OmpA-like peptidoglycan-associated protein